MFTPRIGNLSLAWTAQKTIALAFFLCSQQTVSLCSWRPNGRTELNQTSTAKRPNQVRLQIRGMEREKERLREREREGGEDE